MPRLLDVKLWVPETLEELREIIPSADEEQLRKLQEDGALELRLEEVYILSGNTAYILVEKTVPPQYNALQPQEVALPDGRRVTGWVLSPDKSYILKLQYVKIPPDILPGDIHARSSFHRCGWLVKVSNIDPGFEGHVWVLLVPAPGAATLVLERGARVVNLRLYKLSSPVLGYRGQWQHV